MVTVRLRLVLADVRQESEDMRTRHNVFRNHLPEPGTIHREPGTIHYITTKILTPEKKET